MRSTMACFLRRTTGREIGDQRRADLRFAAAAIPEQEQRDLAKTVEIDAVDYGAAPPLAADEAGARQDRQVGRHRVLRNADEASQFPGGDAFRLATDQQPERVEAGGLRQRRKSVYDLICLHTSRIADATVGGNEEIGAAIPTEARPRGQE